MLARPSNLVSTHFLAQFLFWSSAFLTLHNLGRPIGQDSIEYPFLTEIAFIENTIFFVAPKMGRGPCPPCLPPLSSKSTPGYDQTKRRLLSSSHPAPIGQTTTLRRGRGRSKMKMCWLWTPPLEHQTTPLPIKCSLSNSRTAAGTPQVYWLFLYTKQVRPSFTNYQPRG